MSEIEPNILGGNVLKTEHPTLGELGLGKGVVGEGFVLTPEKKEAFRRIESGEFDVEIADTIASICADERFDENGNRSTLPRHVGGAAGNAHAHDLALGEFNIAQSEKDIVAQDTAKVAKEEEGATVHGDTHSNCGCGEVALAPEIFAEVDNNKDALASAMNNSFRINVSDDQKNSIANKASLRVNNGDFFAEDRSSVLDTSENSGAGKEILDGSHDAELIIWETEKGRSIDMTQVYEELGVKAFVIHAWSFKKTAEVLNITGYSEETELTEIALAMLDLATLSVLCSSDVPIMVR